MESGIMPWLAVLSAMFSRAICHVYDSQVTCLHVASDVFARQ